jgi:thioredoxin-disulfide reductase
VAILGGGPAGMTAAIYSARAGLKPVVIAPATGGQLMGKGVGVENYPGIMEANGGDIIKLMKSQAAKFSATFEHELVASVDLSKRPFVIKTNTSALTAHALIVSTGADSRWLGAPGEDMYRGGGVSSCATCDGFLWREKHCAVIGGGDTAMEDALVLARTSSHVTLIHRRDSFRASHVLQQAVLGNPKITVLWNTTVGEFKGGDCASEATCMLSHLALHTTDDPTNTTELAVDAAFVAIGHIPNTGLFTGQLDMTDTGYLQTRADSTHCSVDGVFASGDVADWVYRQAVTSAGSGSQAPLDAERWLSEQMIGASDEEEAEEACHPEDYEGWTMKKIRAELTSMGLDPKAECRGCMEKGEFIAVLCKHLSGGR